MRLDHPETRRSMSLRQTLASLPRDARDTLFLLFVTAWVIAPQAANLPGWAAAMAGGMLLWRGWMAFKGRPLPGRWLTQASRRVDASLPRAAAQVDC